MATQDNSIQVFSFAESISVRSMLDANNQPWFIAADVCTALALSNATMALRRLDDDEIALITIEGISKGNDQVNIINESGLYSLILTSRKAEAKRFKKWVTSEVLPALRKNGKYEVAPVTGSTALPFLPMSDDQQRGLSDMVYKRARTSGCTVQKIYKELRDVFEVSSWKDIPAEKYTEARMLVKSMVLEGELMPRQTAVVPVAPTPIPHRRDEVLVSAADWQLIVEAFRTLSVAMDEAWDSQGGRSANHYCNPAPRAVQLPYDVASGMSRVIGKVYGYTFGMMRGV